MNNPFAQVFFRANRKKKKDKVYAFDRINSHLE